MDRQHLPQREKEPERRHPRRPSTPSQTGGQATTGLGGAIDTPPTIWPHLNAEIARDGETGHDTQTPSQLLNLNLLGLSEFEGQEETVAG